MQSTRVQFPNTEGHMLSARLEQPADLNPYAYAIFAHCFTCNKNLTAVRNISRALNQAGIAVLRFDFTGLGDSEGDFEDTNFSSNVGDLISAASFLQENYIAPSMLIGHSLGGAAVLFAGHALDSVKSIVTIGAPAAPQHVTHLLAHEMEAIMESGEGMVNIGGRPFKIKKQFIEDLEKHDKEDTISRLRKPLLIMHSPQDTIVGIDQAAKIYTSAHHPKSFVSLDGADHLLSNKDDSIYAGKVIAQWAERYLPRPQIEKLETQHQVVARLNSVNGFTTEIRTGNHSLIGDEPKSVGGKDLGPTPYDYLVTSLATCTAMTIQMYANHKQWPLEEINVHVSHEKKKINEDDKSKTDVFTKEIEIEGPLSEEQVARLKEIGARCPVHRTLLSDVVIQ